MSKALISRKCAVSNDFYYCGCNLNHVNITPSTIWLQYTLLFDFFYLHPKLKRIYVDTDNTLSISLHLTAAAFIILTTARSQSRRHIIYRTRIVTPIDYVPKQNQAELQLVGETAAWNQSSLPNYASPLCNCERSNWCSSSMDNYSWMYPRSQYCAA